jgi:hypothetical protein
MKQVNGVAMKTAQFYKDGEYWHLCILDIRGNQYDGHDFPARDETQSALDAAFDVEEGCD